MKNFLYSIIFANLIIICIINGKMAFINIVIMLAFLLFIEFMFTKLIFKQGKEENDINSKNPIIYFPFLIFLLIIIYLFSCEYKIVTSKKYHMTNDNKVIVYTTNNYYLILDCEIKDDKLIIYKGKQTKIDTKNITTEMKEFKEVKFK